MTVGDSLLPALPGDLTGDLPAVDREHLATFDEQIATLIEEARRHGFSESSILSILAARVRLYAERGTAWKRLVLYGEPLVTIEQFGQDAGAARTWVRDRLRDAVRDQVADTIRTGRRGGRDKRYKAVPFFEAWLGDPDLGDEDSGEAVIRTYLQYVAWLDRQGDVVMSEADAFLTLW
jgi:hypothetical protein